MQFLKKIVVVCTALTVVANILCPSQGLGISVKEEEELSREFLKVVLARFPLIKDPIIVNYVNDIGQKIVSVLPPQPFTYHFYVINEHSLNAFASPAGHIFINSGLIEAMENEEELAGVISHEIGHVACRHISQKIERQKKIGYATLAGIVTGVLLGSAGAGEAASAVTVGSMAAGQSVALAYSRDDEAQADQAGLEYLNSAGYSARGLLNILQKMRSQQWFGPNQIPTYLQTHPASEDRMANIDIWLAKHERVNTHIDPYPFDRTRTWLTAAYGDEKAALKRFESDVQKYPQNPLAHYGYGIILARTGDRTDAIVHLKTALERKAFDRYIIGDLGRVYFLDGRYSEALNILHSAESLAPNSPERLFWLGRTQLKMEQLKQSEATFSKLVDLKPDYPQAYYFFGETCSKLGRMNDAHYYLGIHYKTISNFKNASFHLKKALETMNDPDKRAKIEDLLAEMRKEAKAAPQQQKP
jgi:predicted Zn-dependent protease